MNRPLRPIPSRAIEAGSGATDEEIPWSMMDTPAPRLPPDNRMSFCTRIEVTPAKLKLSESVPKVGNRQSPDWGVGDVVSKVFANRRHPGATGREIEHGP